MERFFTIAPQRALWEQTIKKSDFIVNFARVNNEEEAQAFVEEISKKHYKATHNVFAYVIGPNDEIKRYSDNGEPSGTAGVPMLEVLQKNHVRNVAAVITRYFGGIKLGAGGLIRAYAGTTAQGLEAIGMVERLFQTKVTINIDYKNNDALTYWLKSHDYHILDTQFDTEVHQIVAVQDEKIKDFEAELRNHFSDNLSFAIGDPTYLEIPVK
ncbi:YigZ family protein [Eupransor demetentiae]|uniref:IMPACT (Imprinted ancient) protein family (YIH1) n=1 Tax=Eupransor demetentiae TaxID=3109584 RepID=A0ABM9N741_9LACO|nr:IMPACT (imprinted ancient) protein family (YIH1) [Lactobacillaceae bacterium LMG 33000]